MADSPAADPRVAALMVDRNQNGIPDVIEQMASRGAAMGELALGGGSFRDRPAVDLAFVPPAPRNPSPLARDIVYGYQGSQKVKLILGVVFTLVGLVMSSIFLWGLPVDILIAASGRSATGTVVSTETQNNVKVNGRHPTLIHFRYSDGGAACEGSSSSLDSALLRRATPGTPFPLDIVPGVCGWARVAGTTYSTFGYTPAFVLLFPFIGFFVGLSAYRSNRREILAFERGTPIAATIDYQGSDTSTKMNGRHPFMIRWSFDVNGKRHTGSISHMERSALAPLIRGDQIIVLYDPSDPSVNTAYVG